MSLHSLRTCLHVLSRDNERATSTVQGVSETAPDGDCRTRVYIRSRISLGKTSRKGRGIACLEDTCREVFATREVGGQLKLDRLTTLRGSRLRQKRRVSRRDSQPPARMRDFAVKNHHPLSTFHPFYEANIVSTAISYFTMPAAIKRRKVTATSRTLTSYNQPGGIAAFTRVSKASSTEKASIEKKNYDTVAITSYSNEEKKRKLPHIEEESSTQDFSAIISTALKDRDVKPLPLRSNGSRIFPKTPNKSTAKTVPSSNTPTKGTRSLFSELFVSKPINSYFKAESPDHIKLSNTNPTSAPNSDLPIELLDLINLHAAFLTALSLHYAHNGTQSPADVRVLCPDVARAWGKRGVTLIDIRRSLGVTNLGISENNKDPQLSRLSLSDYGHGKICVEISTASGKAGRMPRPLNENLLNEIFVRGLRRAWEGRGASDIVAPEFISSLPLEAITTCPSLIKISPLLAKGQRRLEDLKSGITVKKEFPKTEIPDETANGKKQSLLERLRAKQLHQSTLPAPPTKDELSRKAALQRIEEVAGVLANLSTSTSSGQQRISFTLPTILDRLRDSCRMPISKAEGTICVKLLTSELAPEWVRLVQTGNVEAIVVNRDNRPSELDIRERVAGVA